MEFIINNWYIFVAAIAVGFVAGAAVYHFVKLPLNAQMNNVRQWLLWAVTKAEQELGGGTGQLKLRQVYDLFIVRFPWLAKIVSFELFSVWVDEALIEMRKMLNTNVAVQALISKGAE